MLPRVFGENLFDEFFDDPFESELMHMRPFGKHEKSWMKTDVKETEQTYELDIDLPGFKKEDIHAKVEHGYLTITAAKKAEIEKNDKKGHYIRKERSFGSCSRSFYVGEDIKQSDIKAKFDNGILHIQMPKQDVHKSLGGNIEIE